MAFTQSLGATKERTYFGSCNCETKKEKIVGFWPEDGENVFLASASARLLRSKITSQ